MNRSGFFNPSSWFNNVFFEKMKNGNSVYTLTNPDLGNMVSVFNGGYSESNMMTMFEVMPELFFVVNAVASRVKNGVYNLVDKDGKTIEDNALWNQIVKKPNWQFSFADFIWHAVAYKLVTGNRYGYSYIPSTLAIKHKNIQSLWLLPSHYVFLKMKVPRPSYLTTTSAKDYVDYYHYNGGDTMSEIAPDYVTHDIYVKMGDSTDIVTGKGISPFKAGEYPLSNLVAVYTARNVIYVKRGPLGAIVSAARDAGGSVAMTPDEKDEVVNDLTQRFGVNGRQSPFAVTNQPVNFIKFGANIAELEPFRETEADTSALCGIIGIPTALMPKAAEAKFANLDIAERNIYENIIFSEAESICQFLTKLGHFEEVGARVVVKFDHISALQDDALKAAQAFQANVEGASQLYDDGHITQNELREMVNRDPIEGGDDYIDEEERLASKFPPKPIMNVLTPENVDGSGTDITEEDEQNVDSAEPKRFRISKYLGIRPRSKSAIKIFNNKHYKKRNKQHSYGTPQQD